MEMLVLLILLKSVCGLYDFDQDDQTIGQRIRQEIETVNNKTYTASWLDLDSRLLPMWFDQAKIGVLLHWGVYSVPAFHSEWFWKYWMDPDLPKQAHEEIINFMEKKYLSKNRNFKYQDFAPMFKAENFEPDYLATTLRESGAKYVLLTSKHHDGFAMFPSEQSVNWNTKDVGPRRDLVGELALAVRKQYMIFGVQYSLYEWFNPMYLREKEYGFRNNTFPKNKVLPELKSIVNRYGPSVIRIDGDWEAPSSYWCGEQFLAWLYNKSPVRQDVVVNDRWGRDVHCKHGDYYSCVAKFNPNKHKWENAFSLDTKSWGYRSNMLWKDIIPMKTLLEQLVDTVSAGGNVLINVGLTKEGELPELLEKKLKYVGNWLRVNGEAIYNTSPWVYQTDPANNDVRYTCTKLQYNYRRPTAVPRRADTVTAIYAIFFRWPKSNRLKLRGITHTFNNGSFVVEMLGHGTEILKWTLAKGKIIVELPIHLDSENLQLDLAWTLKLVDVTPIPTTTSKPKYEEIRVVDILQNKKLKPRPQADALRVESTPPRRSFQDTTFQADPGKHGTLEADALRIEKSHRPKDAMSFKPVPGKPPRYHPAVNNVSQMAKNFAFYKANRKVRKCSVPDRDPYTDLPAFRHVKSQVTPNDTKCAILNCPETTKEIVSDNVTTALDSKHNADDRKTNYLGMFNIRNANVTHINSASGADQLNVTESINIDKRRVSLKTNKAKRIRKTSQKKKKINSDLLKQLEGLRSQFAPRDISDHAVHLESFQGISGKHSSKNIKRVFNTDHSNIRMYLAKDLPIALSADHEKFKERPETLKSKRYLKAGK